ncbi:MAG TPA: TonB-dependent receptor [Candidatus Aquilonibacter sp.]|nr:TonB-dependent receptor [Candidatus Aquilonibacter sp.]
MKGRFGLQIFLSLVVLACTGAAFGQTNAQLTGTVTDQSGGVVGKVPITLRDMGTNVTYSATSNDSGFYAIANLPPGTYELKASYSGFAPFTQTGIVLTVGESATVNIGLQLAREGEKVIVTTEVPVIEPTKTEISQVVGTQQVEALPTSNRVFTDFALLTPGVTTSRTSLGTVFTEFEVTQISFGGMRSFSNEVTVDGADFVNAASGIQRATPPQESVQEFRVVNNSFGADYGRAVGGIVNIVTKSGTNNFHGTAYEYFQNSATDARDLLQPAPLPHELRQNQFGIAAGGPIQKDKTFFFVNYEGKRSANSPDFAPDLVCFSGTLSSNCNGDGGNLTLIDQAKAQMGLAPEGCQKSLAACGGAGTPLTPAQAFGYINGFLKTGNDDFGFIRIDRQLTTNNRLAVRYNVEDVRATGELVGQSLDNGGIAVPSAGRDLYTRDQSVVATVNSVLSPNVVNTVVAQYARRHYNFPGATGQPDLDLANDLQFGHNFGANDRLYETRAELSESVSWVKGNHIAKFGADGNWLTSLENFPGFTPVRLIIPAGLPCMFAFSEYYKYGADWETGGAPASPLLSEGGGCPVAGTGLDGDTRPVDNGVVVAYAGVPVPTDPSFQAGEPLVLASNGTNLNTSTWANAYPQSLFNSYSKTIDHGYWGLFAQDQWRVTPKLTVNFGLRWDVESGLSKFVTQDYRGWQPRVGLAYSPDSKTVLRAGFGMFDDRYNLTFFFVPNTQKTVPGYLCGNHAPANVAMACAEASILPQELPMTNLGMVSQGYQLAGFAGATASSFGAGVIQTGGYDGIDPVSHEVSLVGTCFMGDLVEDLLPGNECGIGTGGMDHNVSKIPYAEQASAEVDRQFGDGFALNVGYLFVGAHRLVRGNNINVPCPVGTSWTASELTANGGVTDPTPEWSEGLLHANGTFSKCSNGTPAVGTGALAGLGPWFAGAVGSGLQTISAGLLDYNNGVANAIYNGLTITGLERIGSYFNLTANYTYSHTIDNGNFTTFINLPVNQFDYAAERANSNQDQRHRFVTNFTATAPDHGWYRNFQSSSIITLQSGRPFTLYYGADTTNDFAGASTDRVGGPEVKNTHCLTTATCQTMIGRNTYIGDPEYTWDLRVSRVFKFSDKYSLVAAVDAFNLLNRANVDQVFSVYGSPVFCGQIPRHYKDGVTRAIQAGSSTVLCPNGGTLVPGGSVAPTPLGTELFIPTSPNATFGDPQTVLNPRQFQFSARLNF